MSDTALLLINHVTTQLTFLPKIMLILEIILNIQFLSNLIGEILESNNMSIRIDFSYNEFLKTENPYLMMSVMHETIEKFQSINFAKVPFSLVHSDSCK